MSKRKPKTTEGAALQYVQCDIKEELSAEVWNLASAAERGLYRTIILHLYRNDGRWKLDRDKIKRLSNWIDNEIEDFDVSLDRILVEAFKVTKAGYVSQADVTKAIARGKRKRNQARSAARQSHSGRTADAGQTDSDDSGSAMLTKPNQTKPNRIGDPETKGNLIEPNRGKPGPPAGKKGVFGIPHKRFIEIYDRLAVQLKPSKQSDKTTIKTVIGHVSDLIRSGQFNGDGWDEVFRMAGDAGSRDDVNNRMAYFTTSIKNHFGAWKQ